MKGRSTLAKSFLLETAYRILFVMFFSSAINASEHILRKSALLVEKMKDLGVEEPVNFQLLNRTFCITLPRKSRWMQAQAVAPADPSPMCRVEKEQSLKEHFPLPCF